MKEVDYIAAQISNLVALIVGQFSNQELNRPSSVETIYHLTTKHIALRYHHIWELIPDKKLEVWK